MEKIKHLPQQWIELLMSAGKDFVLDATVDIEQTLEKNRSSLLYSLILLIDTGRLSFHLHQ